MTIRAPNAQVARCPAAGLPGTAPPGRGLGLLEGEQGQVVGPVVEPYVDLLAGACPRLRGLPDVGVGAVGELQAAAPGRVGLGGGVDRGPAGAADLLHARVPGGEDVQAVVTAQAPLEWYGLA